MVESVDTVETLQTLLSFAPGFVIWVGLAILAARIANRRGASARFWGVVGVTQSRGKLEKTISLYNGAEL